MPQKSRKKSLAGKIALVAGATRGAGRGIAVALGEAGATVYCTGRSSRKHRVNPRRPETIEETAELVTAAGGRGIPVRVDHTDPAQVKKLVALIKRRHRRGFPHHAEPAPPAATTQAKSSPQQQVLLEPKFQSSYHYPRFPYSKIH